MGDTGSKHGPLSVPATEYVLQVDRFAGGPVQLGAAAGRVADYGLWERGRAGFGLNSLFLFFFCLDYSDGKVCLY